MLRRSIEKVDIPRKVLQSAKIAIVTSEFNLSISENLEKHCLAVLLAKGIKKNQIDIFRVPGSLEIPITAQELAQKKKATVIVALGAIIKGETYHFELVASQCARGCMDVSLKYNVPIIYEVLATYNMAQAKKRAGNDRNNKGREAAITALRMLSTISQMGGK